MEVVFRGMPPEEAVVHLLRTSIGSMRSDPTEQWRSTVAADGAEYDVWIECELGDRDILCWGRAETALDAARKALARLTDGSNAKGATDVG